MVITIPKSGEAMAMESVAEESTTEKKEEEDKDWN